MYFCSTLGLPFQGYHNLGWYCIADTIGLCDTEWDDHQIVQMIISCISSNCKYIDAVYIVYRADRLLKDHVSNIKKILSWLNYGKTIKSVLRFNFVGTFADYLSNDEKNRLRNEARRMFGNFNYTFAWIDWPNINTYRQRMQYSLRFILELKYSNKWSIICFIIYKVPVLIFFLKYFKIVFK